MEGVNRVIILGFLGKDPEIKQLDNGKQMATFSVATSESYTNQKGEKVENTEWHNLVFFGKVVDVISKYLKKGNQVYVEGKLNTRSYDDKEGVKRYATQIIGENLTLLGSKPVANDKPSPTMDGDRSHEENCDLPF